MTMITVRLKILNSEPQFFQNQIFQVFYVCRNTTFLGGCTQRSKWRIVQYFTILIIQNLSRQFSIPKSYFLHKGEVTLVKTFWSYECYDTIAMRLYQIVQSLHDIDFLVHNFKISIAGDWASIWIYFSVLEAL